MKRFAFAALVCLAVFSCPPKPTDGGKNDAGADASMMQNGDGGEMNDAGTDGGMPDAGPPPCATDEDCLDRPGFQYCNDATHQCVPGAHPCVSASSCQSFVSPDYCDPYDIGCRCVAKANDAGVTGVCLRRRAPCTECDNDAQCGDDPAVLYTTGKCLQIPGDVSNKTYCFLQHVDPQCPCGYADNGSGYCVPAQGRTCAAPGCSEDNQCGAGKVCNKLACLCESSCKWNFLTKKKSDDGCSEDKTCWVDSANLDAASSRFGAGRCQPACATDSDCTDTQKNPYGGPNLKCAAEKIEDGGLSLLRDGGVAKRCRAKGDCMDTLECPPQPDVSPYVGYCDRNTFACKADCRLGKDPVTGKDYADCRNTHACAKDGNMNICREKMCFEFSDPTTDGKAVACSKGEYCCGEDKNQDGKPDPCPPANVQNSIGCYPAPMPPFGQEGCMDDTDCTGAAPAYAIGDGGCAPGAKTPNCAQTTPACINLGMSTICGVPTYNALPKGLWGCPTKYKINWVPPQVSMAGMNLCESDAECSQGGAAGKCAIDMRFPKPMNMGYYKVCQCKTGSGKSQCPQAADAGLVSECAELATVSNFDSYCSTTTVCIP